MQRAVPSARGAAAAEVARKGRGGGYRLARSAETITIGEALRVLDGPIAPIQCASRSAYQPCHDCPDETLCAVRLTRIDVRDAISSVLDGRSVAELARATQPWEETRRAAVARQRS